MAVWTSRIAPATGKFQHASGAVAKLAELRKVSSWQQSTFVEKGGWATLPGSDLANSAVAQACAKMLDNLE
jgi:nucleoid-associated protein YgaU